MKAFLGLLGILAASPLAAESVWILQTGPEAVASIPVNPVQPVAAWRGLYSDGEDRVWVYATSSPHFFPPKVAFVRRVGGSPWTVVVFFPVAWTSLQQTAWLDRWVIEFQALQSLPSPGWPITFPSVIKKG